jgi:outer membrane protein OmpA-like peptidoglycan-associated protein
LSLTLFAALLLASGRGQAQDVVDEETPPPPSAAAAEAGTEAEAAPEEQPDDVRQPDPNPGRYAPTISGLTGLFRTVTTGIGGPHTFRIALHTEMFQSDSFLVANDEHSRFIGTLAVSYTPIRFAEVFLNVTSMANSNERPPEPDRLDQEVILALGDLSFGGKGQYPITPYLGVGGNMAVTLLNSVGGVSLDGDATGFYIGMISSFDLEPLVKAVPLRAHFNLGYQLDNSNDLAEFDGYSVASMQVEKFALGIRPSRLQIKFGLDFQLRKYIGFGLMPILEVNADVATDDADPDFADIPSLQGKIDGRSTAWLTMGVRANPIKGLNVGLATDVGVSDPGYGYGPPVVPWNLILGVSYAYDPAPPVKVVTREKVKTVVKETPPEPKGGKLRGRVINAKTLEPVEGAVVTFPGKDLTGLSTDPDGTFLTYELSGGKHALMVRHPDYEPAKTMVEIKAGAVTSQDIKLTPAAPKVGQLEGKVENLKGKPVDAKIEIAGAASKELQAGEDGTFSVELEPGSYTIGIAAEGYLRKQKPVTVAAGAKFALDVTLSRKPRRPLVRVTRRRINIRRKVHFATGTAEIRPDSRQVLDAVVDVLLSNPQIKKIEIQGHTDNRGAKAFNMRLSKQRAESVKQYLVENGIDPDRLVAKGYGPTRPKVPNITPRNRARNRRVEFHIEKQ